MTTARKTCRKGMDMANTRRRVGILVVFVVITLFVFGAVLWFNYGADEATRAAIKGNLFSPLTGTTTQPDPQPVVVTSGGLTQAEVDRLLEQQRNDITFEFNQRINELTKELQSIQPTQTTIVQQIPTEVTLDTDKLADELALKIINEYEPQLVEELVPQLADILWASYAEEVMDAIVEELLLYEDEAVELLAVRMLEYKQAWIDEILEEIIPQLPAPKTEITIVSADGKVVNADADELAELIAPAVIDLVLDYEDEAVAILLARIEEYKPGFVKEVVAEVLPQIPAPVNTVTYHPELGKREPVNYYELADVVTPLVIDELLTYEDDAIDIIIDRLLEYEPELIEMLLEYEPELVEILVPQVTDRVLEDLDENEIVERVVEIVTERLLEYEPELVEILVPEISERLLVDFDETELVDRVSLAVTERLLEYEPELVDLIVADVEDALADYIAQMQADLSSTPGASTPVTGSTSTQGPTATDGTSAAGLTPEEMYLMMREKLRNDRIEEFLQMMGE